jgi:hypothetical protein
VDLGGSHCNISYTIAIRDEDVVRPRR